MYKAGQVPALLFYEWVLTLKPEQGFFYALIEKENFNLEPIVAVALDHLRQERWRGQIGS